MGFLPYLRTHEKIKLLIFAIAAAIFGIMAVSQAFAQNGPKCGSRDDITKALAGRYQEAPVGVGLLTEKQVIELYVSADGGSFTMMISRADGVSCIIGAGKYWLSMPYKKLDKGPVT